MVLAGVALMLAFMAMLNARAASGRIAVMSPVVAIAPVVKGTVTENLVTTHQTVREIPCFGLTQGPLNTC